MGAQELFVETVQGRLDGTDLHQYINTVAIVFDHIAYAANLAFDAIESTNEAAVFFAVFVAIFVLHA